MRTGKECHFLKVSEDSSSTMQKRSKTSRNNRARSFHEVPDKYEPLQPPDISSNGMSVSSWQSGNQSRPDLDNPSQVLSHDTGYRRWHSPGYQYLADTYPDRPPSTSIMQSRPKLTHRSTNLDSRPRLRYDGPSADEKLSMSPFQSPMIHSIHVPPPGPICAASVPWPIYAPYATGTSSSRASECSSSIEGMPPFEHGVPPQSVWSASPASIAAYPAGSSLYQNEFLGSSQVDACYSRQSNLYLPTPGFQNDPDHYPKHNLY